MSFFSSLSPVMQALLAGLFTWFCTIIGSSLVFFCQNHSSKIHGDDDGLGSGYYDGRAVWSLLVTFLDYSQSIVANRFYWLPTAVGFIVGGLFIRFIDYLVPHLHSNHQMSDKEGILNPKSPLSKTMLLYLAVVIHNIPDGLAVGVANAATGLSFTWMSVLGLALGIGIQNIPEDSILSLQLRAEGRSRKSAFYYGAMFSDC